MEEQAGTWVVFLMANVFMNRATLTTDGTMRLV